MFWITTIFICLVSLNITSESKYYQRVRNGRDANDGEFPFVVTLLNVDEFDKAERFCTGSIIARDWVLTAAHCMIDETPQSTYIWHSNFTTKILVPKLYVKVKNIFLHSAYFLSDITFQYYNDLSLLRTGKLAEHKVGRLLAVDHLTMIGMPVTYVGSGGTDRTKPGHDNNRPLQVGEAGIGTCSDEDPHLKYVICLVPKCDNKIQVPWPGDSGGPLLYDGRIIGVCSYGYSVTEMKNEAYTAISPHLNWIYDTMQNNIEPATPPVTDAS